MKLRRIFAATALVGLAAAAAAQESFRVSDIRLQGLQRVSSGTVFNLLPVNVGDDIDGFTLGQLTRALFESGYFDDIQMLRDGDVLVVKFQERPAIESIELEGNKAIKSEDLLKGLAEQGLREGEIFKQATLELVGIGLRQQYIAQGRYDAGIETEVKELPRNRVQIKIEVDEGKSSGVRHINIVGATKFEQSELLEALELKHPTWFSFIGGKDRYSREKLQGDMEKLESWYQDRGFVEFRPISTQVSVAPDKRSVYVTINVKEGERYTVGDVSLIGDLSDVEPELVEGMFLVREGQQFSRALVTATEERIGAAFGNAGYTFASASGVPEVKEGGTVDVKFIVDAGKRAYVRRITFAGNAMTEDHVLRRELRQMEGGWASTQMIDLSKVRLDRLGFFENVNVETPAVPGTDDQVDVDFTVEEIPTGSISATLGYAEYSGLIIGGSYMQENVGGSGNSVGVSVSFSDYQKSANFSYRDPYYTMDGISRGFNIFARETDYHARNIARYATDAVGTGVNFGFPIGETRRLAFGVRAEYTHIREGRFAAGEISEFIAAEGDTFVNYKLEGTWSRTTLNRLMFPSRGTAQRLIAELAVPGSDLEFYRVTYNGQMYIPLFNPLTLHLRTQLGYGNTFGDSETYPFYEHYYAGGHGSVRGYENSTLGPRSTPIAGSFFYSPEGDPIGGNMLIETSAELIFPMPFIDSGLARPMFFVDAGNVFNSNCPTTSINCFDFTTDQIRVTTGLAVQWITGMGPMTFAMTLPLNSKPGDEEERFSFEMGHNF